MTFFFDIAIAPLARLTVTIIGSISGVSPTATATANSSASNQLPLLKAVDQEDQRSHDRNEADHHPGDPGDALVEAGQHPPLGDRARHLTESGAAAGECDDTAADAADDNAAHEADIWQIERRLRGAGMGLRVLLERHRLPGQRRLVDEEILCRDQPHVRWDHVAGRQQYDIAGHQLLDRHFVMLFRCARSLPAHGRGDQYHPSQRIGSLVRTMFLDETQRDAQPHHDRDHDGDPLIA